MTDVIAKPPLKSLARSAFGPASGVVTEEDGLIPFEWLQTGHHVVTRDGPREVLWTGMTRSSIFPAPAIR